MTDHWAAQVFGRYDEDALLLEESKPSESPSKRNQQQPIQGRSNSKENPNSSTLANPPTTDQIYQKPPKDPRPSRLKERVSFGSWEMKVE